MLIAPNNQVLGLAFDHRTMRVIVRGGDQLAGQLMAFDLTQIDDATSNGHVADTGSSLVNVIVPATPLLAYGLFCILENDILDDHYGWATVWGRVKALCIEAGGDNTLTPGQPLQGNTSGNLMLAASQGAKILGTYSPVDGSDLACATATLGEVLFNGIAGWNTHAT